MNYGQFLQMMPEVILVLTLIVVFLCDMFTKDTEKRSLVVVATFGPLVYLLCHILFINPIYNGEVSAFGGMYFNNASTTAIKAILTFGALVVLIMSHPWASRADVRKNAGEYAELVISTLLGMFMMVSSGNFLMFFLGLEMASVPMACLVAFDKYKKNSAEGGAKYIITATFSSAVMLYGISFIYGSTGTLYYDDVMQRIAFFAQYKSQVPMLIMGLVFFFSGLGFKLSLVPFHFWTADTYEGAPTPVTGYLSVCSKGAAAFALMTILVKVFCSIDRVLGVYALYRYRAEHHYCQPLRYPSERTEALHGIQFYLTGWLYHVGGDWCLTERYGSTDVLHPCLCRCQHGSLHSYLCCRGE